jgi:hypothetical protein
MDTRKDSTQVRNQGKTRTWKMGMGESLQFHPSPTPPQALGPRGLSISIFTIHSCQYLLKARRLGTS